MKKIKLLSGTTYFVLSALVIALIACGSRPSQKNNIPETDKPDSIVSTKKNLAEPPQLISPVNGAVTSTGIITFLWHSAAGSHEYILQVSSDSLFSNTEEYKVKDTCLKMNISFTYTSWRVKSIQKDSDTSTWSATNHIYYKQTKVIKQQRSCNGNCGACTHPCGRRPSEPDTH